MNDKFSELYHRAWTLAEFDDEYKESPTYERRCVVQSRIFAELIVQECIAIVEPSSYRRAYPENYRGGIDCLDTLDDRVDAIKEHFGIE